MKSSTALRRALLAVALCALVSCATSSPQSRIARNPGIYNALSPSQQDLVARGRIERGLPMDGVFLAWGRPDRVVEWDRSGSRLQRWTYIGLQPVQTYTLGWGWGYGAWAPYSDSYMFGGPMIDWVPYPLSRVDFHHGMVSDWEVRLTRP